MCIVSHQKHCFKFPKLLSNGDGNICKVKHVVISVDDSEEKMVFLVKLTVNERDPRPKLVTYLTSIPKTLQKVFSGNGQPNFTDELIYTSNVPVMEMSASDFRLQTAFFHKDHGIFMKLIGKHQQSSSSSYLFFLPRTSLFTGKDISQCYFKLSDLHLQQNPQQSRDVCFLS